MSINLNIPGFSPTSITVTNPVSSLTAGLGSVANTAQSGVMQILAQLFGALSQMFSLGGQNGQFQANPVSLSVGNQIGQGQQMGHQAINLGNSFSQPSQPSQPLNVNLNVGQQSQAQGSQSRDLGHCGSARSMSAERASQVLNQNFDKLSRGAETFSRADLLRVASDPGSSPELRQAARAMLNDPLAMIRLDTADSRGRGGSEASDGRISKGDLTSVGGIVTPQPAMSTERASQVLNQNFDKLSGGAETFGRNDLLRVANDPNSSPELRQAARAVLNDPQAISKLDAADSRSRGGNEAADGRISKGDLTAVGGSVTPLLPMTTERAAQVLNLNFDQVSDGKEAVTRDDLNRVANDPTKSPEVRQAARFLLDNPGSVLKLDNADSRFRGKNEATDGRISRGDLTVGSTLSDWQ